METGLVVQAPPFISHGERIRVSASEGAYQERARRLTTRLALATCSLPRESTDHAAAKIKEALSDMVNPS
ncbi:MAG TPA: hypothetical protein VH325_16845 [Bryobacteraceae bacterium]|nr:hypothetical protein [Bryobacteraceae bacterium]